MIRHVPPVLAALPVLVLAQVAPEEGVGLWLRLAAATACLLVPGALIARALRLPGVAPAIAFSLAALAAALGAVVTLSTSIEPALWILGGIAAAALPFALWRAPPRAARGSLIVLAAGAAFGVALWAVASPLDGDSLFHLARARKLWAFDGLSLDAISEFRDGGLHPGYAFPLWHAFLALVATLAGVDPALVVRHEAGILAPLSFVVVYEAGVALFRSAWAGAAVLLGQVALIGLAPGGGAAYTHLGLPPTASRQILVPTVLALVFAHVTRRSAGSAAAIAAAGLALAFIHPSYAVFLCLPLAGWLVARGILVRADVRRIGGALAALALPTAAVAVWLVPIVEDTVSHMPEPAELGRAFVHYDGQIEVFSASSYRLAPEVFGRGGAVALAALALVPLAVLASRRRWAAFVLGGSLAVFLVTLVREVFPAFADLVSISQARRAAGFVPFAFAFAGGAGILAQLLRVGVLPLALGAGIWLQLGFPGDFGYEFQGGGPPVATWIAALGGAAALAAGAAYRLVAGGGRLAGWSPEPFRAVGRRRDGLLTMLAAVLFVVPIAVHAATSWTPRDERGTPLTAGLVDALRQRVRPGELVFSDAATSYRIAAYAPVYVAAAPPGNVADTRANRPYERRDDVERFFRTGDLTVARRYGAEWLVLNRPRTALKLTLEPVYEDGRYALYRLE